MIKQILKRTVIGLSTVVLSVLCITTVARAAVAFDPSIGEADYGVAVWTTAYEYPGAIPGEDASKISSSKPYFVVCLIDENSIAMTYVFPAGLVIPKGEIDRFRPTFIRFLPREKGSVWGREFISVEYGNLYKYNVSAQKDQQGNLFVSGDFGKRIPIFLSETKNVDTDFVPYGDAAGAIYFKVDSTYYKWDSTTETYKKTSKPKKAPTLDHSASLEAGTLEGQPARIVITQGKSQMALPQDLQPNAAIDPLAIDQGLLMGPYMSYGTQDYPVSAEDYNSFMATYRMLPGQVLVLAQRFQQKLGVAFEQPLTEEDQEDFENAVVARAQGYLNMNTVLSELKKVQRESGATGELKKWLTPSEAKAIISALDMKQGGHGVEPTVKNGKVVFDHKGSTSIDENGSIFISWAYYRMLKDNARKGFSRSVWETYSRDDEKALRDAIVNYPHVAMEESMIENIVAYFQANVNDQKNWKKWFENINDNLWVELLFDYFAGLSDDTLTEVFRFVGITNTAKQQKFKMIVDVYRKSNLYNGGINKK